MSKDQFRCDVCKKKFGGIINKQYPDQIKLCANCYTKTQKPIDKHPKGVV